MFVCLFKGEAGKPGKSGERGPLGPQVSSSVFKVFYSCVTAQAFVQMWASAVDEGQRKKEEKFASYLSLALLKHREPVDFQEHQVYLE